jgi:hypothetical protein
MFLPGKLFGGEVAYSREHQKKARRDIMMTMAETKGDVIKKVVLAASGRGKRVTDDEAREAIARQFNDFVLESFDPRTPAPNVPRKAIDDAVEFLFEK